MTLGEFFQAQRKRKGMSQRALAERAGYTQQLISLIEKETHRVRLPVLVTVAQALDFELKFEFRARTERWGTYVGDVILDGPAHAES